VTGMAAVTAELAPKVLEYLQEMLPSFRRLGLFLNANDPFTISSAFAASAWNCSQPTSMGQFNWIPHFSLQPEQGWTQS
jgi:hypothetical protein